LQSGENFPVLNSLEESWQVLAGYYGDLVDRTEDEKLARSPLSAFTFYVELGFYPPPEIMLAVAGAFDNYFNSAGRLELEDAFFGERKKGVGNYAARKYRGNANKHFHFREVTERMRADHHGVRPISLEKLAEEFLADERTRDLFGIGEEPDVDSFLRNYRRWKGKVFSDNQRL